MQLEPFLTSQPGDAGGQRRKAHRLLSHRNANLAVVNSASHQNNLNELLVIGDPARLAQVFSNLVSHALKVGSPGLPVWIEAVWCPKNLIIKQGVSCAL
jgi:signal transduction histidine kinase